MSSRSRMHRFKVSLQTKVGVRALGKRAMSVRASAMMIPATRRLMPGVPSSRLMLSSSLRGTVSIRGSNSASHRHREQPDAAAHRARRGAKDRYTILSPWLLEELRRYYRAGPRTWLFPSRRDPCRPMIDGCAQKFVLRGSGKGGPRPVCHDGDYVAVTRERITGVRNPLAPAAQS